ncbi:MAG: hypothetical protein P4M14_10195 [Gammaproteobacteria bacterium]|nr:hypothetical protein [Gammaproteobacteria bacterium]
MVADIPMSQTTPSHIQAEWRLIHDENLTLIKRRVFIDRLSLSNDPNVIQNFIKMYSETKIPEIKHKLIQGTMIYYQHHRNEIKVNGDEIALKNFYSKLLYSSLTSHEASVVVRSFADLQSPEDVLSNHKQIDKQLIGIELSSLVGLKLEIAMKSPALEKIYIPSVISLLKDNKNGSDLDSMFFIIMKSAFKHLKDPSFRAEVESYLDYIAPKYSTDITWKSDDPHFMFAKKYFYELKKISKSK